MNEKNESILFFAVRLGEVMLRSGAETYRVEDTVVRILSHHHQFIHADTFVTPTVIMATVTDELNHASSTLRRIKNRSTRLDKIESLNQLSRDYIADAITFEEARDRVESIDATPAYSKRKLVLATAFSSGFFSLMFQGDMLAFIISFIIGVVVAHIQSWLRAREIVNLFALFVASLFIGSSVAILLLIDPILFNTDAIVVGCIMTLVPGVAFTNAIRDTIGDELLSGISRGVEALFIALAIASGVGIPMAAGIYLGGFIK